MQGSKRFSRPWCSDEAPILVYTLFDLSPQVGDVSTALLEEFLQARNANKCTQAIQLPSTNLSYLLFSTCQPGLPVPLRMEDQRRLLSGVIACATVAVRVRDGLSKHLGSGSGLRWCEKAKLRPGDLIRNLLD